MITGGLLSGGVTEAGGGVVAIGSVSRCIV